MSPCQVCPAIWDTPGGQGLISQRCPPLCPAQCPAQGESIRGRRLLRQRGAESDPAVGGAAGGSIAPVFTSV